MKCNECKWNTFSTDGLDYQKEYVYICIYVYIYILCNYAFHASLTFYISAAILVGDPFVHLLA